MTNLYTKHKHPMGLIPWRIRLFFFFSVMAWVSLFKPDEGKDLVDCADEGVDTRRKKALGEVFKRYGSMTQRIGKGGSIDT